MNFQKLADSFHAPTGIFSVQKTDSGYGEIRLVTGNQQYLYPILHTPIPDFPGASQREFVPNSLYEMYLPKDLGFEDILYRSAVQKMPIHTSVYLGFLNIWFDIYAMPLDRVEDDRHYCTYTAISCDAADVSLSSATSGRAAEDVLKTCIKLHSTNDLKSIMEEVIRDIRAVCRAESCTVLLLDDSEKGFSVLATSFDECSKLHHVDGFSDVRGVVGSWYGTVGGSDFLICKSEQDKQNLRKCNPALYQVLEESGASSLMLLALRAEQELLGFIWVANFDTHNTVPIQETLEMITYFISAQLASYKMMERLRQISYTDRLTGLPNRLASAEFVRDLIRKGDKFAEVSIDLNNFKGINSSMGFEVGNKALQEIARRWKAIAESGETGSQDYIARMDGDEFSLVICGLSNDESIEKTIRQYENTLSECLSFEECDFYITASFGWAVFPLDANTADSLLNAVNAAMHEVKRTNSSNHILRFHPDMLKIEHTLEIERKIREALEQDTLYFHLQPQYDMSHKLRGFEALARMNDTDGNLISPGEFIPVAEKVGLIDKVDGAVFRKSAAFFGELLRKSGADIILSINISVRHMMKNDFLDEMRELLKTSGIPAEQLEIEITESIMIDSAEKALQCINELKSMGVKIAIDDFGTGYSSLSYLNHFPANLLKIDKSFIDKMDSSESSKQYVAAIISMGHIMGFDVISEGVEEEEQLETLRSIGCDLIQGFIWGRPLPQEEAAKLVLGSA